MGKLITSVGPSRFIQRMCSCAIGSGSTNMMVRSDCVLTRIWSMTHMPRSENILASICQAVSLVTSTLIGVPFRMFVVGRPFDALFVAPGGGSSA